MLKDVHQQQSVILQNWSPKISEILHIMKTTFYVQVRVSPRGFIGFEWLRRHNLTL